MTFRSSSLRALFTLTLLTAPVLGCGGSTDTGNPPVVIGQKLRLRASENGVTVSGDAGAVPAGARVEVINTSSGASATTTAASDGSFTVELEGSESDQYRVYTDAGEQSWRTELTSSGASAAAVGLDGLAFLLDSAQGFTPVGGTTVRLSFEAGELGFGAGCNSHFGEYSICDGKLCISGLGATEIGCEPALHEQDEWLATFFTSSPSFQQAGARLTLEGSDATLEFLDREVANPDRPLTGRTWTVDTLFTGGAATNAPIPEPATVVFDTDGTVDIFSGCNDGDGFYTVAGQAITLSVISYTDAACASEGIRTVEQHVQSVLTNGDVSFEIDAARLTIMRGNVGIGATTD